MNRRNSSPVQPHTPSGPSSRGSDSPWSLQYETELRRKAEHDRNHWKSRALASEEELRKSRGALGDSTRVQYMDRNGSQFFREVIVLREKLAARWDPRNWAELCMSALKGPRDGCQLDYTMDVRDCVAFQPALKEIHRQRDEESSQWLQNHAFCIEKQLLCKMSLRLSNRRMFWQNSMMKFDHSARDTDGKRVRRREVMAGDSAVRAPELFNPKQMLTAIREDEVDASGCDRHVESEDRMGAEVRDVEATMLEVIDSANDSACGGMATAGTESNPHWIVNSMDGAGVTKVATGVRVVSFPGSVRKMNQSRHGVRNLVTYQETTMAEDHGTLMVRCAHIRPRLCSIYKRGYLVRPDGSKVYVKFMLSADKSGFCHLMGTRNMNHDAFGTQCDCRDCQDDMYDLTKSPLTHYDHLTFAVRVGRAHVAMHEALEEPEPAEWCVNCDVCGKLTKAVILAERAKRESMSESEMVKFGEAFSRIHFGQNVDQEPVLPYNESCTDILHLYLNVIKVAVAHVFHKPFQLDKQNYSPHVNEIMSDVRDKLNVRMKQDFDDKTFGGEGTFALIGDGVKTFMRGGHNHRLVPDLLAIAQPYLDLLTSDGAVSDAPAPAPAPAAATGEGQKGGRAPGRPAGSGRGRGRGRGARGRGGSAGRGQGQATRTVTTVQQPVSSDDEDAEPGMDQAADGAETAGTPAYQASYKEKVVTMFLSLSTHWLFTHSVNDRDARCILQPEREKLARKAYELGCDCVQAVCAVCGDEARQTYLHDIAYGLQKLFLILGKPYLGATEGNEAAHQEMKKDYQLMCSHSNRRAGSMLQLMRLHHLRKMAFSKHAQFAPPTKYSESALGMELSVKVYKRKRKEADASIPIADGHLKAILCEPCHGETED